MTWIGVRTARLLGLTAALLLGFLSACGGGSGAGGDTPPAAAPPQAAASAPTPPAAAASQPLVALRSEAGDWVGAGRNYSYDLTNAVVSISTAGSRLTIRVSGREEWTAEFQLPGNLNALQAGAYEGLTRYPFQANGAGALSWTGQGRGCNTVTGRVVINSVSYQAGALRSIDMDFEQRCEGVSAALRGEIRIGADAMAQITVPQNPLPDHPVVALTSDVGDYIGGGRLYAYDGSNAVIGVVADGLLLTVSVNGDERWDAQFLMPGGATQLSPGSYSGLSRYPFQARGAGAMSWMGEGRGCNQLAGSAEIRSVRYVAGALRAIDMSFVQRCEGGGPALRGDIRWDADAAVAAPGPLSPVPAGLWTSPDGIIPATGNAMYVASQPGDYIGQGWTWRVGAAVATDPGGPGGNRGTVTVSITESAGLLRVELSGDVRWSGEFRAMASLGRMQAGYYGIVRRYPFHNPARGGMNWSMDNRGCNVLSGWFAIDSISYSGDRLQSIDLRFTQYCEMSINPLRGRIRWNLGNAGG